MSKLFLFGNGLGMSLSSSAYDLSDVMSRVWGGDFITQSQKQLIASCLPSGSLQPASEADLGVLQRVVAACETLGEVGSLGSSHWLTKQGMEFPEAVGRFGFLVSREMYLARQEGGDQVGEPFALPSAFADPLIEALKADEVHVATLNYDGLLSALLLNEGLINEGEGRFRDGFLNLKFDRNNLFRPNNRGSWYMHLHGSPLFTDRGSSQFRFSNKTISHDISSLSNVGRHVVLTHFDHKISLINSSPILSVYWEFFERSLEYCSEIIVFGYSGNDLHVNRMISQLRAEKSIRVVEWIGAGPKSVRYPFWREQFGGDVTLIQMDDVLAFVDW